MSPDDFAEIFHPPNIRATPDITEDEKYAAFVESMIPHCHCADQYKPCDGVLAGGLCDNMGNDPETDDGWVDWEDDGA